MNEHGFTLLCGADCKIFPTGLTTGVPDGLLWKIPIEGMLSLGDVILIFGLKKI